MSLTVRQSKPKLNELLQKNKLIIFVGAGISVDSGLPTWEQFLKKFISFCEDINAIVDDSDFAKLIEHAKNNDLKHPETVAEVLRDKMFEISEKIGENFKNEYSRWILETFLTGEPNEKHNFIVQTDYPFILTTNYDNLLEKAAREKKLKKLSVSYGFSKADELAALLYNKESSIVHIHGSLHDSINNLIITAKDYTDIAKKYPGFRLVMQTLFLEYSILFVGYGAKDPHLENLLEEIAHYLDWSSRTDLPEYYIVLKNSEYDPIFEKFKLKRRINIIGIDNFEENNELLKYLKNKKPRKKK